MSLSNEERVVYLAQACPDASLRAEVESLLAAFEKQKEFLEQPAFSLGLKEMARESNEETLVGRLIGTYEILILLGRGGMGDVYLAEDRKLDRKVALKFLSNKLTDDAWAKRQFIKEAQAVARLDHPNICAVHGFEEHDRYNFIVMQYIEGETLASLIRKGPLDAGQIPGLAIQIVRAVLEAHSHGIVHRDIKPQNIMVTANGLVKVLDFGLAKLVQQQQSAAGVSEIESQSSQLGLVLGTVAYMSPEQLRTERLDFRSDIFSFGIVLYEMISGRNPYARPTNAEIISAILTSDPPPLTSLATEVPLSQVRIVQKCLKKNRELRYQSASELLLDLTNCHTEDADPTKKAHHATLIRSISVLPFRNLGIQTEDNYLGVGMADALIAKLSNVRQIITRPTSAVLKYADQGEDPLAIGRALNTDAVLDGSLQKYENRIRVTVQFLSVADGAPLWASQFDEQFTNVFSLQDSISEKVIQILTLKLTGEQTRHITKRHTKDPEAYQIYLKGRYLWNKRDPESLQKAIGFFKQAIQKDSSYALAYSGLADCFVILVIYGVCPAAQPMTEALEAAETAVALDDNLAEARTSLAYVNATYYWNWLKSESEFRRAIELNYGYSTAHHWYGILLLMQGRAEECLFELTLAQEYDPLSLSINTDIGWAFYFSRQYERAVKQYLSTIELDKNFLRVYWFLGQSYIQMGMFEEGIAAYQTVTQMTDHPLSLGFLGNAYGLCGKTSEALATLAELEKMASKRYVSPYFIALIHIGLGDKDQAFKWLQKVLEERFWILAFLKIDPTFDPLREDERFTALIKMVDSARVS